MSDQQSSGNSVLNEIEETDKQYVFGTWSFQKEVQPKQIVEANGVRFTAANDDEYIDFSSQLMCSNLGHFADRVADAIDQQAHETAFVAPNYTTEARANLGEKLAEVTPGDLSKTFFPPVGLRPSKPQSR